LTIERRRRRSQGKTAWHMRRIVGIGTTCNNKKKRKNWWEKFQLGLVLFSSTNVLVLIRPFVSF
jgi:hypothetical protein